MIEPRIVGLLNRWTVASNLHAYICRRADENVNGDLVEGHVLDGIWCVAWLVSSCPSVGAGIGGVRLVVIDHLLLGYRRGIAGFVI